MAIGLTTLQVYNRALDALGARAQLTSITDVSPECNVLNDNFPAALQLLLEMHDWSFARSYPLLTASMSFLPGWTACYTMPPNVANFLGIWNGRVFGEYPVIPFEVANNGSGSGLIGTNYPVPIGVVTLTPPDPTNCPMLFCDALVFALASQCALQITESAQIGPALMQVAMNQLENAFEKDRQRRRIWVNTRYNPDWIKARL